MVWSVSVRRLYEGTKKKKKKKKKRKKKKKKKKRKKKKKKKKTKKTKCDPREGSSAPKKASKREIENWDVVPEKFKASPKHDGRTKEYEVKALATA